MPTVGSGTFSGVLLAYCWFCLGAFVVFALVAGVAVAYRVWPSTNGTYAESHIVWLIRTFWIAAGLVLGAVLLLGLGLPLANLWMVQVPLVLWLLYRAAKGLRAFYRREALPQPAALF